MSRKALKLTPLTCWPLFLSLVISSASPATRGEPTITITTLSAQCQGAERPRSKTEVLGDTIVITEPLTTPTPCYRVTGDVTIQRGEIVVTLQPEQKGGMCIECLGRLLGEVRISHLPKGDYEVQIKTPEHVTRTTLEIEE